MDAFLSVERIAALRADFTADPINKITQNALTRTSLRDVATDHSLLASVDATVSHHLDEWPVTDQKRSGRCWMFAGLNLLRPDAMRRMNVGEFEFSQNYTFFFDKLERANYFLEAVIDLIDADEDDRTFAHVLQTAIDDGGQWNMFVALVAKHGVVPKSVMPETHASSATAEMNGVLRRLLRGAALRLRTEAAAGADADALREIKADALATVHKVLCLHLGTPPSEFVWQWRDKDKEFHRDGVTTPREFADAYIGAPLADYVCLVNDPRHPYGRTYTVDRLGNIVGGPPVVYLNVDIDVMRRATADTIVAGEPVWFGCDVSQQLHGERGVWDARMYDFAGLYGAEYPLDKAERLRFGQTAMTHAMLFTGVDVVDGEPVKWRVENSWGKERGESGYYTMMDSWFGEYVFEVAVHRSRLSPEVLAGLDTEPVMLPAWDPMGSLAR